MWAGWGVGSTAKQNRPSINANANEMSRVLIILGTVLGAVHVCRVCSALKQKALMIIKGNVAADNVSVTLSRGEPFTSRSSTTSSHPEPRSYSTLDRYTLDFENFRAEN